ncbi:MAG: radical SAM protein [Bacteroidales bacterium]|nr:radical SAM protein [Bacteroidales bacterium]
MATFLFNDLVYGPIHSRRLGNSLGINLLPTEKKYCNFNCIYCECGANIPGHAGNLPKRQDIAAALEKKLISLKQDDIKVDSITFAGNGEPTIHPDFHEVISDTVNLRNKFCPDAKISVLSNATRIVNENTVATLKMIDNCILKIDAGIEDTAKAIDRPVGNYSLKKQEELLKNFDGNFVLQTMFLSGDVNGKKIDNTTPEEVSAWLKIVEELRPKKVMIYTIARDTPEKNLQKASKETLDNIQKKVQDLGIEISVSY